MWCRILLGALALVYAASALIAYDSPRLALLFLVPTFVWLVASECCKSTSRDRCTFRLLGFVVALAPLSMFFLYNWFASVSTPRPWAFAIWSSPCNRSSCSDATAQNVVPYHPGGVTGGSGDGAVMYCPFETCRWADNTGEAVAAYDSAPEDPLALGYPCVPDQACAGLASTDVADYPNKGKGLKNGWYVREARAAETALCPGVDAVVNDYKLVGKGRRVCAVCTPWFVSRGILPAQTHCAPPAEQDFFCFVCPGAIAGLSGRESMDPLSFRTVSQQFLLQSLALVLATMCTLPRVWRKRKKREKNALPDGV